MDRLLNNLLVLAILATLLGVPAYIHNYWSLDREVVRIHL